MKPELKLKILGLIIVVILIVNMTIFAVRIINGLVFWIVIVVCAVFAWKGIPWLKRRNTG